MSMYSMKQVLKQYFDTLSAEGKLKADPATDMETKFLNFYQDKTKYFSEITHAFDIENELEKLKELTSTNYDFSERNKDFIIMLFNEYSGKIVPIRRGQIYLVESDFIVTVYEGFIDIFKDAGAGHDLIKDVSLKMYNRLNVPERKLQSIREVSYKKLEKMINDKMGGYATGIGIMERYQWLLGMEADFKAFITKWEDSICQG